MILYMDICAQRVPVGVCNFFQICKSRDEQHNKLNSSVCKAQTIDPPTRSRNHVPLFHSYSKVIDVTLFVSGTVRHQTNQLNACESN